MLHTLICTALLLSAWALPADEALPGKVTQLIAQLDAAELGKREAAERELLAMGPDVLALLPVVGDRTPAEVALRVTRIQQKLLGERAQAAALPSRVTLSGTKLPLADVLKEIGKQTGNPVVDYREDFGGDASPVNVNADFENTPFWQVMDNVLDQANLTLYGFTGQRGAFVVNRGGGTAPRGQEVVYASLFRLQPLRFEATRDLQNPRQQSLKFFLNVTWEPRLQPFALLQPLSEVRVVADNGQPIPIGGPQSEPESTIREGMSSADLELSLALPERSVTKISTLKGKLMALVPGALEEFRFTHLPIGTRNAPSRPVEQRKAGAAVTVEQVRKNNEAWEVAIKVKIDAPTIALESHRSWILDNETYFVDTDGEKQAPGGFEQTRLTKDEVGITYFFVLDQSPDKLEFVYRTPITVLEIPVEYEFKDLPLP